MDSTPVTTVRHESELGCWEMSSRPPASRLRPYVARMDGHVESATNVGRIREVPWAGVVMILNLGRAYTVEGPGNISSSTSFGSFAAGITDAPVFVEPGGLQNCIQVNFTPIGARLFFGTPLVELTNRIVELADVLGPIAERTVAQIDDTPAWETRFDLIEALIESRIGESREPSALVSHAWSRLDATGGRINIANLADEAGWSRKHLAVQFREQLGV